MALVSLLVAWAFGESAEVELGNWSRANESSRSTSLDLLQGRLKVWGFPGFEDKSLGAD